MSQTLPSDDSQLQLTIQQSLQDIAEQMGEPITSETATQIYQEAVDLLTVVAFFSARADLAAMILAFRNATQDVRPPATNPNNTKTSSS